MKNYILLISIVSIFAIATGCSSNEKIIKPADYTKETIDYTIEPVNYTTINEKFNINLPNSTKILSHKYEKGENFTDSLEVEISLPYEKIKDLKESLDLNKFAKLDNGTYQGLPYPRLLSKYNVSKDDIDFGYVKYTTVTRKISSIVEKKIISKQVSCSTEGTQKNRIIIGLKPINNEVRIIMCVDMIGYGWNEMQSEK